MWQVLAKNVDIRGMRENFVQMGLKIAAYTPLQAELAGRLWNETKHIGLSLADRSCLALALDQSLPVLTADRAWADLDLELKVEILR